MVGASHAGLTLDLADLGGGVYTGFLRTRDFGTVISWSGRVCVHRRRDSYRAQLPAAAVPLPLPLPLPLPSDVVGAGLAVLGVALGVGLGVGLALWAAM